jgi:hypothetical protein
MKGAAATFRAILLGLALILVLTPLTQYLTLRADSLDLETAAPAGWAVGLLTSLVLVAAALRVLARVRIVERRTLVLVYAMLSIAVPMMNLGLVRSLFAAVRATQVHYAALGVNTYRTAYEAQSPDWFPVVPTLDGLAWNKADRLLRLLQDARVLKDRERARREIALAIALTARRLERGEVDAAAEDAAGIAIERLLPLLGADEAAALLVEGQADPGAKSPFREAAQRLGVWNDLVARQADAAAAGSAAAARLEVALRMHDEDAASHLPSIDALRTTAERVRFQRDRARLTEDQRADLERRVAALESLRPTLQADVALLALGDYARVRNALAAELRAAIETWPEERRAAVRTSFLYRSSLDERRQIASQDGREGTPNQNLQGLEDSIWPDDAARRAFADASLPARIGNVASRLPWSLWTRPLAHWGSLILLLFLFYMFLAELLRRKWVEQENLAFPLVEIADTIIRHDAALESAEDVRDPPPRRRLFSPVFWAGALLGALILSVEALGHYGISAETHIATFDVSDKIFTTGFMRQVDKVHFVLSPIAVGILFLVSLEVSFSVWALYLAYRLIVAVVKVANPDIRDSVYTGWGGGRHFPFEMEQLLGACLCLAGIALYKLWRSRNAADHGGGDLGSYVPPRVTVVGLVATAGGMGWLLFDLGIRNVPFLLFLGFIVMALSIAAARVRAETGLPTHHVTYEFTKLPLVFGMTGYLGSKVYTLFVTLAFLPVTLLLRLLGQQLENIELARRNRVPYGAVAVASLAAFATALVAGMGSFLVLAYFRGAEAFGSGAPQGQNYTAVFSYPLRVSHFLGESGLDQFTETHWIRIGFILIGAAAFGLLVLLRTRFMGFPLHPIAYPLILLGTCFPWIVPYFKSPKAVGEIETSWLWGSALVAWGIKKLVFKSGGMNAYKRLKPLFIGLVVGSILAVFVWNLVDLGASISAEGLPPGQEPGDAFKTFVDRPPFNPMAY